MCFSKRLYMTLGTVRHHKLVAFHLHSLTFFKHPLQIDKVKSVMVTSFSENVQRLLHQRNAKQSTVLVASSASVHGVKYSADIIISVGSCSGLPEFRQLTHIVFINTEILLVCMLSSSWFVKHLHAYEFCLSGGGSLTVTQLSELNYVSFYPPTEWKAMYVTLKRYILCWMTVCGMGTKVISLFLGQWKPINYDSS